MASSAFVNPAKYDLYDCSRLDTERKSLVAQVKTKQELIDKARTGAGGVLVGEMVYRDEYIALRAQQKLADEAWKQRSCDAVTPPPLTPAAGATVAPASPPPTAPRAPPTSAGRATSGLY